MEWWGKKATWNGSKKNKRRTFRDWVDKLLGEFLHKGKERGNKNQYVFFPFFMSKIKWTFSFLWAFECSFKKKKKQRQFKNLCAKEN